MNSVLTMMRGFHLTSRKSPSVTPKRTRTKKTTKSEPDAFDSVPSPTHWTSIADNHVPLDVWCLVEYVESDGSGNWTMGYKSSKNGSWIDGGNGFIEGEATVTFYSVLTDKHGKVKHV